MGTFTKSGVSGQPKLQRCRICGGLLSDNLVVKELMFGMREQFLYDQCADCGCLQIDEFPKQITRYYPEQYYSYDLRRHRKLKRLRRGLRRRFILTAPPPLSSLMVVFSGSDDLYYTYRDLGLTLRSSLLDVGAGSGGHVLELRDAGVASAIGLDPFIPRDVRFEGRQLVLRNTLEKVIGEFDFVTFHHSLEHMSLQVESLSQARRLLSPEGQILVRIPTVSSEAFEHYRENWVNLDAPRHFFLHSHRSFEITASQAGLKVVRLWCDSSAMQFMASEQYSRGITLIDPSSVARTKHGTLFTSAQRRHFARKAATLNRNLRGDTICVVLRAC